MILPSPEPLEGEKELPRLPRGAVARDYDLSVEDDYTIWAKNNEFIIKGRRTAAAEVAAERAEFRRSAWAFEEPLSDLSTSEESETDSEEERVTRKPKRERKSETERKVKALPKWDDVYPTPPPSRCGDYDAPPPDKKLKIDFKDFLSTGLYTGAKAGSDCIMPLPMNHGRILMEEERDFRLPFDICYDYRLAGEGRLRYYERYGREHDLHPAPFQRIDKNWFPERHRLTADPKAICMCKAGDSCGEDCINRLMFYLCSPALCPAGDSCTNQPFGYRQPKPVIPFWTGHRGFGLKTLVDIAAGEFIMEYCGEVISRDESYRRVVEVYEGKHDFYLLDYDAGEVLDAGCKGNYARFANHSCFPNTTVSRWKLADLDEYQIGLFAKQDIEAGEELTYDYGFLAFSSLAPPTPVKRKRGAETDDIKASKSDGKVPCMCGAPNCSGWLGAKRKTREEAADEVKAAARAATTSSKKLKR